jgi:lysophospholipase L1-like esterase
MFRICVWQRGISSLVLALTLFFAAVPVMFVNAHVHNTKLVGPRQYYLALGDSMAFGFQPDVNFMHGYSDDFDQNLQTHGVKEMANLSCPGETSTTMINGGCPYPFFLRKYLYIGSQLQTAQDYLAEHRGQVSPVTFNIGSNDLLSTFNVHTCSLDINRFNSGLVTLDTNLTQIILPRLHNALMVNGTVTGDLIMVNYYDPFQNVCPNTLRYVQIVNQHLAQDVSRYGIILDIFSAFGGAHVPNPNICTYTWMCSGFHDIHPSNKGYSIIAQTIEDGVNY